MIADAGEAPAFAGEPEPTTGDSSPVTDTPSAGDDPLSVVGDRYAGAASPDLPPLDEPEQPSEESPDDSADGEDGFGAFLDDAYADVDVADDDSPSDAASEEPPAAEAEPLAAADLWPDATPAAEAATEPEPAPEPQPELPVAKPPTTDEIVEAEDPADLWDAPAAEPSADLVEDSPAPEEDSDDESMPWDPPAREDEAAPSEAQPMDLPPAADPASEDAAAEDIASDPPSANETAGDRYGATPDPLPWELDEPTPAEEPSKQPDPSADPPASDGLSAEVEEPLDPAPAAPADNPLRERDADPGLTDAGSGVEPLPAVPVLKFNTRHMAWLMGGKFGLASLAELDGATPGEVAEWSDEVRRLAVELEVAPPSSLDTPSAEAGRRVRESLDGAAKVGAKLAQRHGADHAALFEIALKSNALLVLCREQPDLAGPVGEAVTDAAERARLPTFLWRDSVRALRSDPDADRIVEALERLQTRVEIYLR